VCSSSWTPAFAWAILLAFAAGFASISALVLFVQDLARFEAKSGDEGDGQ
jgi:hypothetical protein